MNPVQLEGELADLRTWMPRNCSIARALDVVGTRSAMLIMREAQYGTTRFDEFARRVGITEAVAASRLRELVDAGLLVKEPYREPGQRTRHEYRLTPMGRDLLPTLIALMQWGDTYLAGGRPPLALTHAECGAPVRAEVRCADGHAVDLPDILVTRRPGRAAVRSRPDDGRRRARPTSLPRAQR
jgi:DNA-binding HxlR family transcriptional regulator